MVTENTNALYNMTYLNTGRNSATMILEAAPVHQAKQKARLWVVSMNAAAGRSKHVLGEWERGQDADGAFEAASVTGDGVEVGRFVVRELKGVSDE